MASCAESFDAEDDLEDLFRDGALESHTTEGRLKTEDAQGSGVEDVAKFDDALVAGKFCLNDDDAKHAEVFEENIIGREGQCCPEESEEAGVECVDTDRADSPCSLPDPEHDKRIAHRGEERATANATARDVPPWAKSLEDEGEDHVSAVMRQYPHEEFPPGSYRGQGHSIEVVKGAMNIAGVLQEIEIRTDKQAILMMNRYPNGHIGLTVHAVLKGFKKKSAKREALNQKGVSLSEAVKDLRKAANHVQQQDVKAEEADQSPMRSVPKKRKHDSCLVILPVSLPPPPTKKRKLASLDKDDEPFSGSASKSTTDGHDLEHALQSCSHSSRPDEDQPSVAKRRKTYLIDASDDQDHSPTSSPPIPIKSWHAYRPAQTSPLSQVVTADSLPHLYTPEDNDENDEDSDGSPTRAKSARKQGKA